MGDYDILFLSRLFPKELYSEISTKSRHSMEDAQNELQWNLIEGIDKYNEAPVKIINTIPIGSFPQKYHDIFVRSKVFQHSENAIDINVGFLNLCYIKYILLKYSILPHVKKWAQNNVGKQKVLISYSLDNAFLYCIKYAKKLNSKIICCTIVADLPEYIILSKYKTKLQSLYTYYSIRNSRKNISYIDLFVLLTKQMKSYLGIEQPYIVMEGIATDAFKGLAKVSICGNKTILYSGTLNEKFGIVNLLNAFSNIKKDNYRLVICGFGDSVNKINEMSIKDPRILYKGQLPHTEVLKLQAQSTVLINPRQNNEEFTRYSFPSKNMEYLSSGRPVIAYKLDGIPDEYDDYIQYVEDNSIESLSKKIIEICEKSNDELDKIGFSGREFVLKYKNKFIQAERIMNMIKNSIQ